MHPILRGALAVVLGLMIGGFVNMGIVSISNSIIPLPAGVDPSDPESIKANLHLYEFKHFIFPFLAHALGTLVGAFIAGLIAVENKMWHGLIVGLVFLMGGIMMVIMVSGPIWFIVLDLAGAYLPMGYLGARLACKDSSKF